MVGTRRNVVTMKILAKGEWFAVRENSFTTQGQLCRKLGRGRTNRAENESKRQAVTAKSNEPGHLAADIRIQKYL